MSHQITSKVFLISFFSNSAGGTPPSKPPPGDAQGVASTGLRPVDGAITCTVTSIPPPFPKTLDPPLQSNASLAKSEFFDILAVDGQETPYTLLSCAGSTQTQGRVAKGYIIESLDGHTMLKFPTLLECDQIPNDRNEIPTPDVAQHHTHLKDIAKHIPPLDNYANILLLLGRDIPEAHHVLDQRIGMLGSPYAHKLRLGWIIIGEACLGKTHQPDIVNVNKTRLLRDGRP